MQVEKLCHTCEAGAGVGVEGEEALEPEAEPKTAMEEETTLQHDEVEEDGVQEQEEKARLIAQVTLLRGSCFLLMSISIIECSAIYFSCQCIL